MTKSNFFRAFGFFIVLCFSPHVFAAKTPAATITASPNPCIANPGSMCATTVTWNAHASAQVLVQVDQGTATTFACNPSGSQIANWIQPGHTYVFTMYSASSCTAAVGAILGSVNVSTVPLISGGPSPCAASASGTCTETINWNVAGRGQLWVQMDSQTPTLVACGAGGPTKTTLLPNHSYTYSVYNATSCKASGTSGSALGTYTVEGTTHPLMGMNKFDLFLQYLGNAGGNGIPVPAYQTVGQAMARKAMFDARNEGAAFMRVSVVGYAPSAYNEAGDLTLWQTNPTAYWALMDQMMSDLDSYQLKIIPTFMWNSTQFPAMTGETLGDMMTNTSSQSYTLLKQYIMTFINRYKGRKTIEGYELTNELNLGADIDSVNYCLTTTAYPQICQPITNYTTDQMIAFTAPLAAYIKSLDPSHFVESGYSLPRPAAQHLRAQPQFSPQGADWTQDTLAQLQQNLSDVNQGFDLISIHVYGAANSVFWGITGPVFLETIKQMADQMDKPLYIGEYGDTDSASGHDSTFSSGILSEIDKVNIQYSSPWILEFYQFNPYTPAGYNIEPGYTDSFISEYKTANKALGNAVNLEADKPQVVLTWPLPNSELAASQMLYAVASTGQSSSITQVGFFLDNVLQGIVSKPPYTLTINTSSLAAGSHTLTAYTSSSTNGTWESHYSVTVTK